MSSGFARRRARAGTGLLPGNPRVWECEHNGLDLREDLRLGIKEPLPVERAFHELLDGVTVRPLTDVPCAKVFADELRQNQCHAWSALALPLGDGRVHVVYNDAHSRRRNRVSLMEEFFHLRLGHPPTSIRWYNGDGPNRSYNSRVESEAYGSAAAALIPYKSLRSMVVVGDDCRAIAEHFRVSEPLVVYRCKRARLYRQLRSP